MDKPKQAAADSVEAASKVERQLAISDNQAKAAQNGVKAMQRQMRQDQRAWIKMEMPANIGFTHNQPVETFMSVSNIGKTAAKDVTLEIIAEKLPIDQNPSLVFKPGAPENIGTVGSIFPGVFPNPVPIVWYVVGQKDKPPPKGILSKDDIVNLIGGKTYFAFFARARYTDVFGIHHTTKYCGFNAPANPPVMVTAQKCTAYNSVDNN